MNRTIEAILLAAGSSIREILKTTVLVTDLATYDVVNAVYATFFDGAAPPARVGTYR